MAQGLKTVGSVVNTTKFVNPYPQPSLGGEPGLTSYDIAASLGIQPAHVHEKLQRGRFADGCRAADLQIIASTMMNKNGVLSGVWILDVNAAKSFVARWDNATGWGYMKHLLSCERVAEQQVPKLLSVIEKLQARVAALTEPKQRRIPGRGVVSVIVRTLHVVDMFGEIHDEIRREKKVYSELSPSEQRAYKIQHRSAVMKAIAALQDEDLNPKDRDTFH